jgi:S1-C subfamily serine protease
LFEKIKRKRPKPRLLKQFLIENIKEVKIQMSDGNFYLLELIDADLKYDCSFFKFKTGKSKVIFSLELDDKIELTEGIEVAFAGFPTEVPQYKQMDTPFAVNEGIIASFPDLKVGGLEKHTFVQVNAVNLGGNSGAPLFLKNSGKVIGITTGNQNKRFNIVEVDESGKMLNIIEKQKADVTVFGVAYAVPIKYILNLIRVKNSTKEK